MYNSIRPITVVPTYTSQMGVGERHCENRCLAQEHNTISPARAPTQTAQLRGKGACNHEATVSVKR